MVDKKTILIVDDEPLIVETFQRFFAQKGFNVLVARNGHAALKQFEKSQIDVVLLDVLMPEQDGVETLIKIRQRDAALPVYVMSGGSTYVPENFLSHVQKLGATGLFQKPLSQMNLNQILEVALR